MEQAEIAMKRRAYVQDVLNKKLDTKDLKKERRSF